MEEKVEYWMEKYDRDVEQKQHELDVLKVCISYFMLVSKRSVRAGGSIITEGSAILYSLPPSIETQLGGGVPQASFAKLGEMRSHWYENEFLFSYKYNSFSPNTRNSEMANRWRSFQLIWRVSATENSVLASKIDFKAILIVLFVGF